MADKIEVQAVVDYIIAECIADDLAHVFASPWWKFWRRPWRTRQQAAAAIQAALTGNPEPIRAFGVNYVPRPGIAPLQIIEEQTARLRKVSQVET